MKIAKCILPKYRAILTIIILAVVTASGYTQVNQDELQNLPPVVFLNYEGPYTRIDTREQIRQIGVVLGVQIFNAEGGPGSVPILISAEQRRTESYTIEAGARNRYFVIHCVSEPDGSKIDADIFILGADAGVDHIRNLRTIIQGYLQAAYSYSEADASLLAEYITVYNAVYRGNWEYFSSRYKTQVMDNLVRDRAGLSIRYDEWPGRTMILIPLGYGGLSSVDTSVISDSRVIEEMRREDDLGVQQRQDMVNLMDREADEAEQRAQAEREAARQEETAINTARTETAQERQNIDQERQSIQQDQEAGRITQEQARQAQEDLDRREQAVDERDQELDDREAGVDQRREEAQMLDEFAGQRTEQAQQGRQDIARDQQAAITETPSDGVLGVTIERVDPTIMGRVVRINPATGMELRRSPVDTVHVRTVTFTGGRILAVAGENRGNGAVRLVELNQTSLEISRQGDDDIMTGSLLWLNNNDLYAITVDLSNNYCYLGRFNTNLILQVKSSMRVHSSASVTIQQGRLLTQREDGSVLILNPTDLTEMR